MDRVRLATIWLGGCSGCHMSFLDLDELLIELAPKIDLVFSPLIDVKEFPENVDLCLVEGAVCNEDNLEFIRKVRLRTRTLVSFGDCAVTANVPAIRNQLGLRNGESVLQRAYVEGAQGLGGIPREPGIVPELLARVMPVHEVVYVDYFLPGCPPPVDRIKSVLTQVVNGAEPCLQGLQLKFG
jgi:NAD-reducing hydrogenase small subunit